MKFWLYIKLDILRSLYVEYQISSKKRAAWNIKQSIFKHRKTLSGQKIKQLEISANKILSLKKIIRLKNRTGWNLEQSNFKHRKNLSARKIELLDFSSYFDIRHKNFWKYRTLLLSLSQISNRFLLNNYIYRKLAHKYGYPSKVCCNIRWNYSFEIYAQYRFGK